MPFGTYLTPEDALRTAARILKEGRMGAVKLEGGVRVVRVLERFHLSLLLLW
jgi:ketopantoate hydroxymethyltransferase